MKCEDCLFYEILCRDTLQENELQLCNHFKNKADYAEVKHGEWIVNVGMNYNKERICTVCHQRVESNHWIYCPNCGVKMDGRSDV